MTDLVGQSFTAPRWWRNAGKRLTVDRVTPQLFLHIGAVDWAVMHDEDGEPFGCPAPLVRLALSDERMART